MGRDVTDKAGGGAGLSKIIYGGGRPVWLAAELAAEFPDFGPTPELFGLACDFIGAEAARACYECDGALLSRAGFLEALEFVMRFPRFAPDESAFSAMLGEWRKFTSRDNGMLETMFRIEWRISPETARRNFWRNFDAAADGDEGARDFRRRILATMRGSKLRMLRTVEDEDRDTFDAGTDGFIFPATDTANPERGRVLADWMNYAFAGTGERLAEWLSIADIPNLQRPLEKMRAAIAYNYGVFPAPFTWRAECGKAVALAGDELKTLAAMAGNARKLAGGGNEAHGAANPADGGDGKGVGRKEMASLMGVSEKTVFNWETRRTKPPIVDGVEYSARIRDNAIYARLYADKYKTGKKIKAAIIGGEAGEREMERQSFMNWQNDSR